MDNWDQMGYVVLVEAEYRFPVTKPDGSKQINKGELLRIFSWWLFIH
jgi:hypothetical protein